PLRAAEPAGGVLEKENGHGAADRGRSIAGEWEPRRVRPGIDHRRCPVAFSARSRSASLSARDAEIALDRRAGTVYGSRARPPDQTEAEPGHRADLTLREARIQIAAGRAGQATAADQAGPQERAD